MLIEHNYLIGFKLKTVENIAVEVAIKNLTKCRFETTIHLHQLALQKEELRAPQQDLLY